MLIHLEKHCLDVAQFIESPNFNERPHGQNIDLIVIHSISMPPGKYGGNGIIELFTNRLNKNEHPDYAAVADLHVSAHVLIRRDGALIQFVPFHLCAWHAGKSSYQGREDCNDFSIGIELEGTTEQTFEAVQYTQLATLVRTLIAHYPDLSEQTISYHSDIAPGRKTDPGTFFERDFLERY